MHIQSMDHEPSGLVLSRVAEMGEDGWDEPSLVLNGKAHSHRGNDDTPLISVEDPHGLLLHGKHRSLHLGRLAVPLTLANVIFAGGVVLGQVGQVGLGERERTQTHMLDCSAVADHSGTV